jgi:hypothetical protein
MRNRLILLTVLATGALALFPAAASASFPWADQEALKNETDSALRATYIVDAPAGTVLSRQLFLSQPYLAFYQQQGFDRNFFTWAPHTSVGDEYMAGKGWTGCASVQIAVPGRPSYCGAVKFGAPGSIRADVLSGPLTGFRWGEHWISDICGNWAPANLAPKLGPTPTISGVKYEDLNANGVRDSGEPGIPGWKIELLYEGHHVATTTTGSGGAYAFHLNADTLAIGGGTYTLREESRSGWHQEEAPGKVVVPYGAGGKVYGGNDFGNWRPATISGAKFDDSNVDGEWGEGESGVAAWGIELSNGEEQATGPDGSYSFEVRPGTYTVAEVLRAGWRQTAPGAPGSREYTVLSGQAVSGADFGNVCLGGVEVEPIDDSTGEPAAGLEVRIEEVSVPGILENEPSLPLTASGAADFEGLLPGTYRVVAFLPEGVFTTDPDAVLVEGRFAIVKEVTVAECETTDLPVHTFTGSSGKVTGGVRISVPGGFATAIFEFMVGRDGTPRGTLEYQDHATGLNLHTATIEAVQVAGDVAWIWGKAEVEGTPQRFELRLVDAGEPGTADRFELTLAPDYEAGHDAPIEGGNVQIHG